jgi:alpha-beta hydrolase superfamily lysophospholipase
VRALFDPAPGGSARLLVMLPAAKARPEDFFEHGFVAAVRARGLQLDIALPDAHAALYLEGDIVERLESAVMQPMRAKGYAEIWLAGVSLGGMGSIAYACRHAAQIAGVMLLAPFLGLRDANREPELLRELARSPLPNIFLGYGTRDRYARASELLARRLPAGRVTTLDGGHDWPTWLELWKIMLALAVAR